MVPRWKTITNFGDTMARVSERIHSSGARIVEVLYGAEDSSHNPIEPWARDVDGHGHCIAIEIDGLYSVLYWRRSRSLRIEKDKSKLGVQEYGTSEYDALRDVEDDIRQKEMICAEAARLVNDVSTASKIREVNEKLHELLERWKTIQNWNTPKEKELWGKFHESQERVKKARKEIQERAERSKREIISEARKLSASEDWKQTGEKFKELLDKWKASGSAGKDKDENLWQEFESARKIFFDRRTQYFADRDEKRERSKNLKFQLLEEAISVVKKFGYVETTPQTVKDTRERLNDIMSRWKAAGSAGKKDDDNLWEQFNKQRQDFNAKAQIFFQQRDEQRKNNAAIKSRICSEAASLASSKDYSSNAERMRELDRQWRSVGSAGEEDSRLWDLFSEAKKKFWDGKRYEAERKHEEWRERTNERIYRKKEQVSNLYKVVERLRERLNRTKDYLRERELINRIGELENKIDQLKREISEMESRL